MKAAFITDEDQFTASKDKEYNLNELVKNNYAKLHLLREGINTGRVNGRINNMTAMSIVNLVLRYALERRHLNIKYVKQMFLLIKK